MKCPVDGTELLMTERQGVEIDYCPKCRGVWLDRGELDKIIEKATPAVELDDPDPYIAPPPPSEPVPQEEPVRMRSREEMERGAGLKPGGSYKRKYDERYDDDDYRHAKRYKKKRKKSVLSELFDIFD